MRVKKIPLSPELALLAITVVFFAATVQGSFGIGGALLAAPVLLLIDPVFVPVPVLAANVVLTFLVARKEWRSGHFQDLGFILFGRVIGTIPAVFVLAAVSGLLFDFLFGAMILLAVILSVIGRKVSINPTSLTAVGFASGFMGTVSSIGGPPVALLYQHTSSQQFRATLSIQLLIGAMISIAAIALGGGVGRPEIVATAILMPGVLLGFVASRLMVAHVTTKGIRVAVLVLSVLGAVMVLSRATLGWMAT